MGKNQHSKDRLFITATEWATQYGGHRRRSSNNDMRPLPYDHCALSLAPFQKPAMLSNTTGVVFDLDNITPYIQKHGCDPVTGDPMTLEDIIPLNMSKNVDGEWECPITNKVFTASTHIVAIKTSGNVYSYNAVDELNIKAKSLKDLIDGTPFKKSDIITLQDPQNPEIMAKRDIGSFKHLEQMRAEAVESRKNESKVRHSAASEGVLREIEKRKEEEKETGKKRKTTEEILLGSIPDVIPEDVERSWALEPLTEDVNPGQKITDGKAGMSFTSTSSNTATSNKSRRATIDEIREGRWKIMRKLGKKAYVQLQTNFGNINLELHCDIAMRTCWNFLMLCKKNYYNNTKFHRLVPKFVLQGGDPTNTGAGGDSAFEGKPFRDEFDLRITHAHRGILSMANSGPNTNGSQFFLTLNETKHLDLKHTVFGRVVGGAAVLDAIEAVGADRTDTPLQTVRLIQTVVFSDPMEEADKLLEEFIKKNIADRKSKTVTPSLPATAPSSSDQLEEGGNQLKRMKV